MSDRTKLKKMNKETGLRKQWLDTYLEHNVGVILDGNVPNDAVKRVFQCFREIQSFTENATREQILKDMVENDAFSRLSASQKEQILSVIKN